MNDLRLVSVFPATDFHQYAQFGEAEKFTDTVVRKDKHYLE